MEADPSRPDQVVGFDVEIADLLARGLGRTPRFVKITFTSIDQSIARDDADIGLSGIEDTPTRRATLASTIPYYEFREVLSVRDADAGRVPHARGPARPQGRHARRHDRVRDPAAGRARPRTAGDLLRRRRASRTATSCSDASTRCCWTTSSPNGVGASSRASRFSQRTVAVGHYVGVLAPTTPPLRDACNEFLREAMRDGSLERILRKWGVWNADQPPLHARLLAGDTVPAIVGLDDVGRRGHDVAVGSRAAISAVAAPRLARHDRAVVRCRWAWRSRSEF